MKKIRSNYQISVFVQYHSIKINPDKNEYLCVERLKVDFYINPKIVQEF